MLRYIFISVLFFLSLSVRSQVVQEVVEVPRGFTLGVNLAGPINKLFDTDRTGISFLTRINLKEDLFFIGEAGFENVNFEKTAYHYDSNGTFIRVGAEMDVLPKKEEGSKDNLLVGLQYGFALQEQGSSYFLVENGYWEDYTGRMGSNTINTHWIELSGGPRAELFKNFYMSWNLHIRVSVASNNASLMEPYIVPGFGNGDSRLNAGFSYVLEYMIPWTR
ncbi:DUF6048 family protein [Geofilum rubicundum]|uniref:Outer membrane protein beta-barrel domain-containing protein n=1 Tax=Geofilum rubicundum JCM 15548 TaxID=1236989 RepID=A0A0E9LWQ7_9BACT|nr:DUF6048 family protein [Geofilum rubicundum]GAO29310.1 hypothetical protein JCM15548_11484 [Geofilum rubicundum JCM 15548]